eukprot:446293-Pleurochrysis_carterae.AAC.1
MYCGCLRRCCGLATMLDILRQQILLRERCTRRRAASRARSNEHHGISRRTALSSSRTGASEPAGRAHDCTSTRSARRGRR